MIITETINNSTEQTRQVILDHPAGFSLSGTLISGQCFRWRQQPDGSLRGVAGDRAVTMLQRDGQVVILGDDRPDAEDFWRDYLDFGTDYAAIRRLSVCAEPRLESAVNRCGGVFILRQQPWEALCSFIVSQNNNIPRIRTIIDRLCRRYGQPIAAADGTQEWAFPSPEAIASAGEEELKELGLGYRAGYLPAAARDVLSGSFDPAALRELPLDEARKALQAMKGVGLKVADCVLLFGLHRLDAFPRDVWIKRALEGEFRDTPLQNTPYAGVAQQYIFEYIRTQGSEGSN
ncbi:MAG: DNA-3-methyladenine glycosylase 2 family protein [Ruminococcaceae bacterium]|nr:DNA-3-methyladenine glycosylase 2 family protein [Oscillospiraceae bacterium]